MQRHDIAVGRRRRIHLRHRISSAARRVVTGRRAADGDAQFVVGQRPDAVDQSVQDARRAAVGHRPHVAVDVRQQAAVLVEDDLVARRESLVLSGAAAVGHGHAAGKGGPTADRRQVGAQVGEQGFRRKPGRQFSRDRT